MYISKINEVVSSKAGEEISIGGLCREGKEYEVEFCCRTRSVTQRFLHGGVETSLTECGSA